MLRVGGVNSFQQAILSGKFAILMDGGFVKRRSSSERRISLPSLTFRPRSSVSSSILFSRIASCSVCIFMMRRLRPASWKIRSIKARQTWTLIPTTQKTSGFISCLKLSQILLYGWASLPSTAGRLDDLLSRVWQRSLANLRRMIWCRTSKQKGVDLRIGLDIARLALRQMVSSIVVVTGDSDLIPAFKFARREGCRVYLDHMGHGVKRELKVHADLIL